LEITYLGHSAFRLRGKEVSVVTDPYAPEPGISMGKPQAQIVTVSHGGANHSPAQGVGGEPRIVHGPGEYEIENLLITGVATASEPGRGALNTAYVVRFDDLTVCHLGDMSGKLSDAQVEAIGNIDLLLVPVGGGNVLGPRDASTVINQLDPKIVVPMHYAMDGSTAEGLEPVDHFCRELGMTEITREPKLSANRSSLPSEVRVVVLEAKRV
jgi:L-ascorbate metabolism protein UlaG (beta-lactamase superfamily)